MVSLKNIEALSYRQLQSAAKRTKVPANLKKSYLIQLIIARSQGDENLIKKIVENAYQERAHFKKQKNKKINPYHTRTSESESMIERFIELDQSPIEIPESRAEEIPSKTKNWKGRPRKNSVIKYDRLHNNSGSLVSYNRANMMKADGFLSLNPDQDTNKMDIFDPEMRMVDPVNHAPRQSENIIDEIANIVGMSNYCTSNKTLVCVNASNNTISKNLISTPNHHGNRLNNVIKEVTNTQIVNEYNRVIGQEHSYSHAQSQQMDTSSMFSPQNFYKNVYDGVRKEEKFIVINQHIQYYDSSSTEQKRFLLEQQQQRHDKIMNSCAMDMTNSIQNNGTNELLTLVENQAFTNESQFCTSNNFTINANQSICDSSKSKMTILSNTMNSKTFATNASSEHQNSFHQPSSVLMNNMVKRSYEHQRDFTRQTLTGEFSNPTNTSNVINHSSIISSLQKDVKGSKSNNCEEHMINDDLDYDVINEDISSTLHGYFDSLNFDCDPASITSDMITESNVEQYEREVINNNNERQISYQFSPSLSQFATSMICFICDWLGKICDFGNHVQKKHSKDIFKTYDGMLTLALNMGTFKKNKCMKQQNCFIEHAGNLYIIHLEYKHPDVILPILLSIPPSGQNFINDPLLGFTKFHLQVINFTKQEEIIWMGKIECMNIPGRPLDIDVYSNRKHGRFEITMRSLDLVPTNIALKDIPKYLDNCIVEMHFFIETLADLQHNMYHS